MFSLGRLLWIKIIFWFAKPVIFLSPFIFFQEGHIEHEESAEAAVIRELLEESGSHCTIKRFLGCLEHCFEPGHNSICHNHEYNFFFEAESDALKIQNPLVPLEDHIELVWLPFREIDSIDFRPEPLKTLLPEWFKSPQNNAFQSMMGELESTKI
jgi:8-oxo-dGTP diphosphatase